MKLLKIIRNLDKSKILLFSTVSMLLAALSFYVLARDFYLAEIMFLTGPKSIRLACLDYVDNATDEIIFVHSFENKAENEQAHRINKADLAVPFVSLAIESPDPDIRFRAIMILSRTSPSVRTSVVKLLIKALRDRDYRVKAVSINLLGDYGQESSESLGSLQKLLAKEKDVRLREMIVEAIKEINLQSDSN